jgi:hypothetical protein
MIADLSYPPNNDKYLQDLWVKSPFLYNKMLEFANNFLQKIVLDNESYYLVPVDKVLHTGWVKPEIIEEEKGVSFKFKMWSSEDCKYKRLVDLTIEDRGWIYRALHYFCSVN